MRAATELASRLGKADAAVWASWLTAMQKPVDEYGIAIRRVGEAVALHCHAIPSTTFNRIANIGSRELHLVPELLDFYRERATPVRVDLNPFVSSEDLLRLLPRLGLHPIEFQSNLYRELEAYDQTEPRHEIREVVEDELDSFASLYENAYNHDRGTPPGVVSFRAASIKARWWRDDWRFYVVLVEGMPAGGGALHVDGGVATLAGGATLPGYRGRGCQSALLLHRANVAKEMGCDLLVSRCSVGSPSQRNLERAGLVTAYTKVIWAQQMLEPFQSPRADIAPAHPHLHAV